jgi:hypothetical protein
MDSIDLESKSKNELILINKKLIEDLKKEKKFNYEISIVFYKTLKNMCFK